MIIIFMIIEKVIIIFMIKRSAMYDIGEVFVYKPFTFGAICDIKDNREKKRQKHSMYWGSAYSFSHIDELLTVETP